MAITMMCPIAIVAIKIIGFKFHIPMLINMIGNCNPKFNKVGKNGPHSILGGFATAFRIISLMTQAFVKNRILFFTIHPFL